MHVCIHTYMVRVYQSIIALPVEKPGGHQTFQEASDSSQTRGKAGTVVCTTSDISPISEEDENNFIASGYILWTKQQHLLEDFFPWLPSV